MLLTASRCWGATRTCCINATLRPYSCKADHRWTDSTTALLRRRSLSTSNSLLAKKRRGFFSSNAYLRGPQRDNETTKREQQQQAQEPGKKRESKRSAAGKTSLRRVAVEAQTSRDGHELKGTAGLGSRADTKTVTAICAAEQYDIARASHILQTQGYRLDPYGTGLYPQVVHIEIPVQTAQASPVASASDLGDIFVFPSGTVVSWAVPNDVLSGVVSNILSPAAINSHPKTEEEEDLEYIVDPQRESSSIKGDTIILGTKQKSSLPGTDLPIPPNIWKNDNNMYQDEVRTIDTVLAKIAFSSGLARSTKLAVLETLLSNYFQSTKSIPAKLSLGGRIPFTRKFILQKTGELLNIRAQLNLYSELTDSLPDLFWDSRHELGLEGYFDQVGRALDTTIRIKVLNEKMDYAQEIASVLRQQLSEQHGVRLEWIIILLIAVEVGFEVRHLYKEYRDSHPTL